VEGDFLKKNKIASTPSWSSIRELKIKAANFETEWDNDTKKGVSVLIS
jgi:hypothetical protein